MITVVYCFCLSRVIQKENVMCILLDRLCLISRGSFSMIIFSLLSRRRVNSAVGVVRNLRGKKMMKLK